MDMLTKNDINIMDLPDEMLLMIIHRLNNIDILYSLVDVNQRFDQLALNSVYIRDLDFTVNSLLDGRSQEYYQFINRICKNLLSRIHHQVNTLTLDHISMKHVLHTFNFPQLHSLSLVLRRSETFLQYLTGDTILHRLLRDQIRRFNININLSNTEIFEFEPNLFAFILSLAKHLADLTLVQQLDYFSPMSLCNLGQTNYGSSTLTKLEIDVLNLDECRYILDGRFDSLSTLIVYVKRITLPLSFIPNGDQLPKLKCFSLTSPSPTTFYDDEVVLLLRRMLNLEELTLFLVVRRYDLPYIDGNHLSDEILIHMPRLNKFTFSINTQAINLDNNIIHCSNEDIQRSFIEKKYQHVGSYADDNPMKNDARCHIYSLPYQFKMFYISSNSFQGGMFEKVQWLVMNGTHSFEHEFFKIISQSFPCLRRLFVVNNKQQENKQHSSTPVIFPQLTNLNLTSAHIDYAEQFLLKRKTCLPRLLHLHIKYESLQMITNHFTINRVHFNCAQIEVLSIDEPFVRPENFHLYFPQL